MRHSADRFAGSTRNALHRQRKILLINNNAGQEELLLLPPSLGLGLLDGAA